MLHTLLELGFILNRYMHIVCTTVIVGGTLFYELIVPVAIGDLKREQQLSVFGRARWSFKTLMWVCAVLMIVSGLVSSIRLWSEYTGGERTRIVADEAGNKLRMAASDIHRPGWWWAGHVSTGLVALCVAVSLMTVRRPPEYPLYWMRLSLMILLVVVFMAVVARHMRIANLESARARNTPVGLE